MTVDFAPTTPYVDYDFYSDIYQGSLISEEDFSRYIRQATAFIDAITFGRVRRLDTIPDQVKFAVCAAMEVDCKYAAAGAAPNVKSENSDGYSVTYGDSDSATVKAEMQNAASLYLSGTGLLYKGRSHKYDYKRKYDHI